MPSSFRVAPHVTQEALVSAIRFGDHDAVSRVAVPEAITEALWPVFSRRANRGSLPGSRIFQTFEEAGLGETLASYSRESISELAFLNFDAACALAAVGAQVLELGAAMGGDGDGDGEHGGREEGDDPLDGDADQESEVCGDDVEGTRRVELDLVDFIKFKLGKLPGVTARKVALRSPFDDMRPRSMLLIASALTIILVGIAVTTGGALMWLNHATGIELSSLSHRSAYITSLSAALEQSILSESARNMITQSLSSSRVHSALTSTYDARRRTLRQRVANSVAATVAVGTLEPRRWAASTVGEMQSRLLDALVASAVTSAPSGLTTARCTANATTALLSSGSNGSPQATLSDIVSAFTTSFDDPWRDVVEDRCATATATPPQQPEYVIPPCGEVASASWQPRLGALATCARGYGVCHRWSAAASSTPAALPQCFFGAAAVLVTAPAADELVAWQGLPRLVGTAAYLAKVEGGLVANVSRILKSMNTAVQNHTSVFPSALLAVTARGSGATTINSTTTSFVDLAAVVVDPSNMTVTQQTTPSMVPDTVVCSTLDGIQAAPYPRSAWVEEVDSCSTVQSVDNAVPYAPYGGASTVHTQRAYLTTTRGTSATGYIANGTTSNASSHIAVALRDVSSVLGVTGASFVIGSEIPEFYGWREQRAKTVTVVNHLNFAFARTTELVVGGLDDQGILVPQMNSFRFTSTCFETCFRTPPSTVNMVAALTSTPGSYGWSITPDYRPYPCVGAYTDFSELSLGFVMERDVHELRSIAFNIWLGILNAVQLAAQDTMLVEAFHLVGAPPMPYFSPSAPCPQGWDCRRLPNGSLYFEYGCRHCEVLTSAFDASRMTVETLYTRVTCGTNCTRADGALGAYFATLDAGVGTSTAAYETRADPLQISPAGAALAGTTFNGSAEGYSHVSELASYAYVSNFSTGIRLSFALSELYVPLTVGLGSSVAAAVISVVVGVLLVLFFSNTTMNRIDETWSNQHTALRENTERFNSTVRDVIAPQIIYRLLNGESAIAEKTRVAIVAVDLCGFSKYLKEHPPAKVARLVLYVRQVVREVAAHPSCDLIKLHCFGDTMIYYAAKSAASTSAPAVTAPGGGEAAGQDPSKTAATTTQGGNANTVGAASAAAVGLASPGQATFMSSSMATQGGRLVSLQHHGVSPTSLQDRRGHDADSDVDDDDDLAGDGAMDSNHPACRGLRFATGVMGLFSEEVAHFPNRCAAVSELFEDLNKQSKRRYVGVPPLRIACHWGTGFLTVADHPMLQTQFDVLGSAVSIATRLLSQTAAHEIAVTSVFREMLRQNDPSRAYTFSDAARLPTRGGGTTKHLLTSWKQRPLTEVEAALGVSAASSDFPFDPELQQKRSLWTVPIEQYKIKLSPQQQQPPPPHAFRR